VRGAIAEFDWIGSVSNLSQVSGVLAIGYFYSLCPLGAGTPDPIPWALDPGPWTLDPGPWTLDPGP
jgi:hypothetical protein